jgi:hypothetical protein
MVSVRDKLCWGRSVGAYLSGDRITVTEVGATLTGRTILKQYKATVGKDGPGAALKKVFEENLSYRQRRSVPVCIGLGSEQTFFMTCVSNIEAQQTPSLKSLMEASGIKSGLESDDVVADYFRISKLKLMGNQFWTLAACRRELAQQLYSSVQDAGFRNFRLQPGPLSLLTATKRLPRRVKSWKVIVYVLLHATGGLVVLVIGGRTVLWREFTYSPQQRQQIVNSAIRTVLAYTAAYLSNPVVDGIILQGDKAAELAEEIANDRGLQVEVIEGEGFTDAKCSYGLALSAKGNDEQKSLDLFRTLRDEPSILAMFPWKRAASVVFMIACMGFIMWQKVAELTGEYNNFRQQNALHEWSEGQRTGEIKNERKQLLTEVQAVSKFLSSRIIWSDYLRDLPTRLPTNACLSNIWAVNELKEMSKKKQGRRVKQSLTMRGVTRFDAGIVAPQEIEAFLESLRNVELLKRDFPKVQLAEIKWRREGESEIAMFTVVAMPKKKSAGGDDKDEKE